MRDPKRIARIVRKFEVLWDKYPDQRFGQLVSNLQGPGRHRDLFFPEDDAWEKWIDEAIETEWMG